MFFLKQLAPSCFYPASLISIRILVSIRPLVLKLGEDLLLKCTARVEPAVLRVVRDSENTRFGGPPGVLWGERERGGGGHMYVPSK